MKKFIFSKSAGLQAYSRQLYYQTNSFKGIFQQHFKPPMLHLCTGLRPPIKFWRAPPPCSQHLWEILSDSPKIWEPNFWEVINSSQVWQPQDPFAAITSLSELYFRLRFIVFIQTKKLISLINYGSSTSSWKAWTWVRVDLILTNLWLGIYISSPWNNHQLLDWPIVMQFC